MRHHYHYQEEVTREPDLAAERAEHDASRLASIAVHSRLVRDRHDGHVLRHVDADGRVQGEYDFSSDEGPHLLAHLAEHAHIELPPDLVEHLKLYTDESAGEEES